MKFSQEYIGAVVILIISVLKIFGIEIANDVMTGLVTGLVALYVAILHKKANNISVLGKKL